MELIRINDAKLKVMLDASDMHDLSICDIHKENPREALSAILSEAKRICGFDTSHSRIFVQMYPCRKGGCELYVTKLEERKTISMFRTGAEQTVTEHRRADPGKRFSGGYVIYAFREMGHMLSTCACLLTSGYGGGSSAWQDPGGLFYLYLDKETFFAGEHFGRLCPSSMYYYINEHCRLICREAVPILGHLA
ncbi:MAG: adaptor protein MecA [Clostridia bacterium]|nr:adaptor protein MecA [Clostridia bacterium]